MVKRTIWLRYSLIYTRQIRLFKQFLASSFPSSINELDVPSADLPSLICAWIYHMCERPDLKAKDKLARETKGHTYQHAEKMRAAITFYYSYEKKLGNAPWRCETNGAWTGNPNNSDIVSRYMKSLRRRKVYTFNLRVSTTFSG